MNNILINGRETAEKYLEILRKKIKLCVKNGLRAPNLITILIGNSKSNQIYIDRKERKAKKIGINSKCFQFNEDICQNKLIKIIEKFNINKNIDGILIQHPLPKNLNFKKIFCTLNPKKDVEGMHPINYGKLLYDYPYFIPCTPKACLRLIEENNIKLKGAYIVIVGSSLIAGKPLAFLLMNKNATVTICNKNTKNLAKITRQADILISATGVGHLIKEEHVSKGVMIIDIGINQLKCGKIIGDVDIDSVKHKVKAITPVPGGVGPVTIAMLLENTYIAYKRNMKSNFK